MLLNYLNMRSDEDETPRIFIGYLSNPLFRFLMPVMADNVHHAHQYLNGL